MRRIGIAASKMSKKSLLGYNLCVILIACLFSLFVFLICGFVLLPIVFLVFLAMHAIKPAGFHAGWVHVFKICLFFLASIIGVFTVFAIAKNVQFTKNKI
ncbi:MAG: hypothetical protein KGJ09_03780 [Candidatus Omnitrophica bacterium]|nr:hypothetical protein [Candidatus Omnitrophota bacterium]MDE2009180.1 hypothetical protein [Candidatus Omnitrophota bacterium]MDE2213701.1 hypothetical protein [Candidatus Omnitrophota bacterium]MDE2230724.1 hypothetical protein [Candidatus Omnitrophota bacterium]